MVDNDDEKNIKKLSIEQRINKMSIQKKILLVICIGSLIVIFLVFLFDIRKGVIKFLTKNVARFSVVDIAKMNGTLFREGMTGMIKNIENIPLKEKNEVITYVNKSSEDFRIRVLKNNIKMIKYFENQSENEKQYVLSTPEFDKVFEFLKNVTPEERLEALKINPDVIKYIKNPIQEERQLVMSKDPSYIRYINNPTAEERKIALSKDLSYIRYINNPTTEDRQKVLSKYPRYIGYINNPSEEERIEALTANGCLINYLFEPTFEERMIAVRQNANALQFIETPTNEEKMIALKQKPFVIEFIENPSKEERLLAIKGHGNCIKYITNPTANERAIALETNPESYKYIHDLTKNEKSKVLKLLDKSNDKYYINFNGGYMLKVKDDRKNNELYVYDSDDDIFELYWDSDENIDYEKHFTKLVKKFKYEKILIGICILDSLTDSSHGYQHHEFKIKTKEAHDKMINYNKYETSNSWMQPGLYQFYDPKEHDGEDENTILIQISKNRYVVFTEGSFFEFNHPYQIIKFFTQMGNSSCEAPYAIDEEGNYLLLTDEYKYFKIKNRNRMKHPFHVEDNDKYDIFPLDVVKESMYISNQM